MVEVANMVNIRLAVAKPPAWMALLLTSLWLMELWGIGDYVFVSAQILRYTWSNN